MTAAALSPRAALIAELADIDARRGATGWEQRPVEERRALIGRAEELHQIYFRALPQVPISRCPTDGTVVSKKMDLAGLDGPWWALGAYDGPPEGDPHVLTYTGAMRLETWPKGAAGGAELRPGPEVPYVIPRMLGLDGVVCVVSSMAILPEDAVAYFVTYFAEPRRPAAQAHQLWLRDIFYYIDPQGFSRWNVCNDAWDFDLKPWIERGKLFWTAPGDPASEVMRPRDGPCPYLDLPGVRAPRSVVAGKVSLLPLPDGAAQDFFE